MIFLSLVFLVLLESTVVKIPLLAIFLLNLFVRQRNTTTFIYAFFVGIVFDILIVQKVGFTSLYLITFLYLVYLYQRKFEINTLPFVLIATKIAVISSYFIFGRSGLFLMLIISLIFSVLLFYLLKTLSPKLQK